MLASFIKRFQILFFIQDSAYALYKRPFKSSGKLVKKKKAQQKLFCYWDFIRAIKH